MPQRRVPPGTYTPPLAGSPSGISAYGDAGPGPGLIGVSATALAEDLDDRGVVRLRDAVSREWITEMRAMVDEHLSHDTTGADIYLDHADHPAGTPSHGLVASEPVRRLLEDTTRLRTTVDGVGTPSIRCSMLIRAGGPRSAPTHLFHYDPCVLTMVVPIVIPDGGFGERGELVAEPNKRPHRRRAWMQFLGKVLTHNVMYRRHFTREVHRDPQRYTVPLEPGDAVLFWGDRTFHGNLDSAPGQVRATLVVKCGQTHPSHRLVARAAWMMSRSRRDLHRFGKRTL